MDGPELLLERARRTHPGSEPEAVSGSNVADFMGFLGQYLQNPRQVGSLAPSSGILARAMVQALPLHDLRVVVEYGPGTGALTRLILDRLPADARYYALEPNAVFRARLRARFPRVLVIDDAAEHANTHLGHLTSEVDAVFSGLPFSMMSWPSLTRTLAVTNRLLRPGGHFRAFVYHHIYYLPKLIALRKLLSSRYQDVRTARVWANLPPAVVVSCIK
jgi:phosphatidylethanolamine/phosphatidyl-N-methylethanolamine N-methyltransferase